MTRTAEFVRRVTAPDSAVLAQLSASDEITGRILRTAQEQFELVGIRRTSMEDIARQCGVGKATLYRRFPTKDAVVDAVVLREVQRYLDGNDVARSHGDTFEERLINGVVFTVEFVRGNALLNKLRSTEPETILRSLTVDADPIIDWASEVSAALLAAELFPDTTPTKAQRRQLLTAGELQTRLTLSFALTPHTTIDRSTPAGLRAYVLDFILPLITDWNRPRNG
ncbi:MAG: TetR family transcriptional regulator [Mycobacterium sp.]|uniref:TetR/AcrR family transcriptional regulator n=1 Tax=Mycobacterium sp. TaxID=1785 RepID=UPI003BAED998